MISFIKNYRQTEIANWSFKFNSTDSHGNAYEIYGGSHIVDKDTITINIYTGNNSNVNRSDFKSGNITRIASYVYNPNSNSNTTNVSQSTLYTYITNGTDSWNEWSESINSTGVNYYLDFNPNGN